MPELDERRASVFADVARSAHADPLVDAALIEAYYDQLLTEDLAARDGEDLRGAILSHIELGRERRKGETLVRACTPRAETQGWAPGSTVIQIVAEDTPFLVDSITAALDRLGQEIRFLTHPVLHVVRDEGGVVTGFSGHGDKESWIHVEVPQAPDRDVLSRLENAVREVLVDVATVVGDWAAMTDKAREIAASLGEGSPSVDEDQRANTEEFMEWLTRDHFVFLGYRRYELSEVEGGTALIHSPGTGLGLMRAATGQGVRILKGTRREKALAATVLVITKANSVSTVHRAEYLDYIGVKTFDAQGRPNGEHRFIGLFTSNVYHSSVHEIPVVSAKVARVLAGSGHDAGSHAWKRLDNFLERYPRDELFQADVSHLAEVATRVVASRFHGKAQVFVRPDVYGRFTSCLVLMPRDRYTPEARDRVQRILMSALRGNSAQHSVQVTGSAVAMVHFIIRSDTPFPPAQVDIPAIQERIRGALRTWAADWFSALVSEYGEAEAARLAARWRGGFDDAYRALYSPRRAAIDVGHLERLDQGGLRASLYRDPEGHPGERRFRVYSARSLELTEVLPILLDFGLRVIDERTHTVQDGEGSPRFILEFGVAAEEEHWKDSGGGEAGFVAGFLAVWDGTAESDGLNRLIGTAGLTWVQIVALRMLATYLRQTTPYSLGYLERALIENPAVARELVALFEARFGLGHEDRRAREDAVQEGLQSLLAAVPSLDHDRMLAAYVDVIRSGQRTNFYQSAREGSPLPDAIAFKLDPRLLPHLPAPRPEIETWVYGPTLEGVHLRFGKVARGGLRWSDRRDDFRTEILGLVKAQAVKNAVIVPAGAKGGFYPKRLPDPQQSRAAWLSAGRAAYTLFVGSLLAVSDTIEDGVTKHPDRVVRHDGDDPYLVVAADKGTATFSDLANEVSEGCGFWLGDAFASGGSSGYDHKAMGITARGAWESVKRHFYELDLDPEVDDFTVVGVGDMSGDVFGNGMLLSRHIELVAAFDHRSIFVDPTPDPERSFAERRRLFELPHSSWTDYEEALISSGGGVFSRAAKSIDVTAEMRAALGMPDVPAVTPAELIRAILTAPVDLLWNGGIGTYVKARAEANSDVGDRTNDAVRVDGRELRCRVVGEGGNLGVSQRGRIEAAESGVRINTDAIDNSGGVDSSDQEVNIKILLNAVVKQGRMTRDQRDELLFSMTEAVSRSVLRTNYEQNVLLANERSLGSESLGATERLMTWLEQHAGLDRAVEALPHGDELSRRAKDGRGLTSPELSMLVAYAKLGLKKELLESDLPEDPWFLHDLEGYFAPPLRHFRDALLRHPLKREIIATRVANAVVNRGGVTFVQRAMEDSGAAVSDIVKAFVVACEALDSTSFFDEIETLDGDVASTTQRGFYREFTGVLDRAVRYLLGRTPPVGTVDAEIDRYVGPVQALRAGIEDLHGPRARGAYLKRVDAYLDLGAPRSLAHQAASLPDGVGLLSVVDMAAGGAESLTDAARGYLHLVEELQLPELMDLLAGTAGENRWDAATKDSLRQDMYRLVLTLTGDALDGGDADPAERVRGWAEEHRDTLRVVRSHVERRRPDDESYGLAQFLIVQRELERLTRPAS
ncbi:NAD-glutamate dehydrogenase [Propionicicella superfundia]|uniref:NAD-glutamate dehydrogenase n=1 Tax=Propionicicella superfundia TaxID=348582 RepID=UPI000415BAEF|nr:NAD-glutamate dehydrogenase [Propionicicella superfundia]